MRAITLTTDFGVTDWFVGSMKGVILGINPAARLIDITHEVPPGNIAAGALALASSFSFFPRGTVHLVVVDPGVGSDRAPIAIQTSDHLFVGPDNGVLALAAERENVVRVHRLENPRYFRECVSRTFHGRDLFAPVAAHLSRGVRLSRLGPKHTNIVGLSSPHLIVSRDGLEGEIVHIDHFGNAQTNIRLSATDLSHSYAVRVAGPQQRATIPFVPYYQAVPAGKPLALINSSGFVEVAINGGHAARKLRLKIGQKVFVRRQQPR